MTDRHRYTQHAHNNSHLCISKSIWPGCRYQSASPWGLSQIRCCFPACLLYRTHISDLTAGGWSTGQSAAPMSCSTGKGKHTHTQSQAHIKTLLYRCSVFCKNLSLLPAHLPRLCFCVLLWNPIDCTFQPHLTKFSLPQHFSLCLNESAGHTGPAHCWLTAREQKKRRRTASNINKRSRKMWALL